MITWEVFSVEVSDRLDAKWGKAGTQKHRQVPNNYGGERNKTTKELL